jgi:hypothetical protein
MRAHAVAFAHDRLDVVDEGENVGLDADLFGELARRRLAQRLADFHHAAGQRIDSRHRRARPPCDQHQAVTEHRGRGGQDRPGWVKTVIHAASPWSDG